MECLDPDRVTLTLQIETAAQDDVNDVNSDVNDVKVLTDNEEKILSYLKAHPTATIQMVSAEASVGRATVDRAVRKLKDKGFLKREVDRKKGIWVILK